jgi:hypothetical protein
MLLGRGELFRTVPLSSQGNTSGFFSRTINFVERPIIATIVLSSHRFSGAGTASSELEGSRTSMPTRSPNVWPPKLPSAEGWVRGEIVEGSDQ